MNTKEMQEQVKTAAAKKKTLLDQAMVQEEIEVFFTKLLGKNGNGAHPVRAKRKYAKRVGRKTGISKAVLELIEKNPKITNDMIPAMLPDKLKKSYRTRALLRKAVAYTLNNLARSHRILKYVIDQGSGRRMGVYQYTVALKVTPTNLGY